MPVPSASELRRLLGRRLLRRAPDAAEVAHTLVDDGCRVDIDAGSASEADLAALVERISIDGLAPSCQLTLPVGRFGPAATARIGSVAVDAGMEVVLSGAVDVDGLPGAGVVVRAGDPGAEDRCRAPAGRHVRLVAGPGRRGADLAFVRCLNVLMAEEGRPGIAVSDPRLIAIAGERAAWNGRAPDSWELVMPFGVHVREQRRLVAAGDTLRVTVPAGGRS